eukprot:530290_1
MACRLEGCGMVTFWCLIEEKISGTEVDEGYFERMVMRLFKNYNTGKYNILPSSYQTYIFRCNLFPKLLLDSIKRIFCRLAKGIGFKCNCIGEILIAYAIIIEAQECFIEGDEHCVQETFYFEKNNQQLDTNFLLVYEKEFNVIINPQFNNMAVRYLGEKTHRLEVTNALIKSFDVNSDVDEKLEQLKRNRGFLKDSIKKIITLGNTNSLIDYENPLCGNIYLWKKLNLDKIHPSKWFIPFDRQRFFDYRINRKEYYKIKARQRCAVCASLKWKDKNLLLGNKKLRKCSGCKLWVYCSRKCQKYDWSVRKHREVCGLDVFSRYK